MTREVGEPVALGGDSFTVGISDRSGSGRLTATGTVLVVVPDSGLLDQAAVRKEARALALRMVGEDPGLLTPVRVTDPGRHTPLRSEGDKTPWSDGEAKHGGEKGAIGSSGILSPDTGQVNI